MDCILLRSRKFAACLCWTCWTKDLRWYRFLLCDLEEASSQLSSSSSIDIVALSMEEDNSVSELLVEGDGGHGNGDPALELVFE